MNLLQWAEAGHLRKHETSREEIHDLSQIVIRDLTDARTGISPDWRFGIAHNAVLKLATILLHASGYRSGRSDHHYRTLQAIPLILSAEWQQDARYLDACRKKRNIVEYDCAGGATDRDADELIAFVERFREAVLTWLGKNHPDLLFGKNK